MKRGGRAYSSRAQHKAPPVALTIAGSDPTGGAGLQSDLKTFERFGVVGAAVVTAITVQTATRVIEVKALPAASVAAQLKAVFSTATPRVVKCGLLPSIAIVKAVATGLRTSPRILVIDPVTTSSAGTPLGKGRVLEAIVEHLFPLAAVVTVNLAEAEALVGGRVCDEASMSAAGRRILALGPAAVVVKGGHLEGAVVDVLVQARRVARFGARRIPVRMHGTGCAFASAIAAGLAQRSGLEDAVAEAGRHVRGLLRASLTTLDGGRMRAPALRSR